jgi:hypothetical protein
MDEAQFVAEFERKGVEHVRMLVFTGGYNPNIQPIAVRWLAAKKQEAATQRERAETEQVRRHNEELAWQKRIARSTEWAAWLAALLGLLSLLATVWAAFRAK